MKNLKQILLAISLLLIPVFLFAYSDPKGWFKCQQDVEENVSNSSQLMSTISYEGKLWNFIYYSSDKFGHGTIIQRKLSNLGGTEKIDWDSPAKDDDISQFQKMGSIYFQPAPVIYKNKLYLFFNNQYQNPCYSVYNPSTSTWSNHVELSQSPDWWDLGTGAVATVVDDKVCIVTQMGETDMYMVWSNDLKVWHVEKLGFKSGGESEERFGSLSGLTTTIMKDGKRKQIMMVGYVNPDHDAYCATIEFDSLNNILPVTRTLISNAREYQCAAIAEGTVMGDPKSTGHCIQAFLKRENKDDASCRYRIIRCQLQDGGSWEEREDNLVKKNYMWADHELNLTVANFAVPDGKDFRQYMCLIYRGYDDKDHPFNCAWAETDKAVWLDSVTDTLKDAENIHYIGFIEGPPPFVLNDPTRDEPYTKPNVGPISEVVFETGSSEDKSTDYKMDVGVTQSLDIKWARQELSQAYNHVWNSDSSYHYKESYSREAGKENLGLVIYIYPEIQRDHYKLVDVTGALIDSIYFFQVTQTYKTEDTYELKGGLISSDPNTYMKRSDRDFTRYKDQAYHFGPNPYETVTWNKQGRSHISITLGSSTSNTNGTASKIALGYGKENEESHRDIFNIGFEGSFEWTSTVATTTETTVEIVSNLNDPVENLPGQANKLEFKCYWIKPNHNTGVNNWWLPEGAKSQDAWCITYEVITPGKETSLDENSVNEVSNEETNAAQSNTTSIITPDNHAEQLVNPQSVLSQNYPNPFAEITKIKYQVGSEILQADPTGCVTKLVVYNLSGQQIATLVNENKAPGVYEVEWDASQFTPGVYYYSLQCGSFKDVKKLILMK